jgi:chemotaxis protein MotB
VPIETTAFPSNWELSAVRATTVLRYLVRGGINPERLTATGYGDALPIASNNSLEGRAENRRIEFVLEKVAKP